MHRQNVTHIIALGYSYAFRIRFACGDVATDGGEWCNGGPGRSGGVWGDSGSSSSSAAGNTAATKSLWVLSSFRRLASGKFRHTVDIEKMHLPSSDASSAAM